MLVTGFGPFPGVDDNVSGRLVNALGDALSRTRARTQSHILKTAVLPVDWSETTLQIEDLYERHRPDAALHFGVSQRARGFEIETVARNRNGGMVDASGRLPEHDLLESGAPPMLRSTVPVKDMIAALRAARMPVRRSQDAGDYLCNAALFRGLRCVGRPNQPAMAGFVHIPVELRGSLSWPRLVLGANVLIGCLVHALAGHR